MSDSLRVLPSARSNVPASGRGHEAGFTLLELMIVVTILAIVASIGVPQYLSALRTARIGKSKHELVTISHAVDAYAATNNGQLPLTLHQVGFGGKRDPWGTPYCFLNYVDGTGDGLEWAIAAGIVDPSAFQSYGGSGSGGGGGGGGGGPLLPGCLALLGWSAILPQGPVIAGPDSLEAARTAANAIAATLDRAVSTVEIDGLVDAITKTTGFGLFVDVPVESTRRRDRYMFPLNTDYDLFSLGPDGRTAVSLGETVGLDDVIRANNGGFFGLAADY